MGSETHPDTRKPDRHLERSLGSKPLLADRDPGTALHPAGAGPPQTRKGWSTKNPLGEWLQKGDPETDPNQTIN